MYSNILNQRKFLKIIGILKFLKITGLIYITLQEYVQQTIRRSVSYIK